MHLKRTHPALAPLALAAGLACLAGAATWAAGADPRGDHREQLWQLAADVGKRSGTPVRVDPEILVEAVPEDPGALPIQAALTRLQSSLRGAAWKRVTLPLPPGREPS